MKKISTFTIGFLLAMLPAFAAGSSVSPSDTVRGSRFGLVPDTYENSTGAFRDALEFCRLNPNTVLVLDSGRYDIWPDVAVRKEIYISNTSSESECPSKVKTIGLHLDRISGLTLEGNGATLMMHGKITPLAVDSCRDISIRNLSIDFERPGGSELTYVSVKPGDVLMKVHRDTRYDIRNGRISLIGEGWKSNRIHCIRFTPSDNHFSYSTDWQILQKSPVREISPGLLRFSTPADFNPPVSSTLTLRDIIRDQVGTLILSSSRISLSSLNVRYMHGLGIVSQYSRDITMSDIRCCPSDSSGRLLASSADFMHFSGCSGHIDVQRCEFAGAHDDGINVHGTNLQIQTLPSPESAVLRFMHHQTYGFLAYNKGDTVAFVNPATMLRTDTAVVVSSRMLSPREISVTFDRRVPASANPGATCVENLSATPTLHVADCSFSRLSTRGILATTPGKVVIERCRFVRLGMPAVLIEADAAGWFESGPVTDVTIRDNTFIDCNYAGVCGGATIAINPSNSIVDPDKPVHTGITIVGNVFMTEGRPVVYAKSASPLRILSNRFIGAGAEPFIFEGCSKVIISGNKSEN